MRPMSRALADKFHDIVDRAVAALQQQRAIEARRVLGRYRHLLETQHDTPPLNEIISVCNEKDILDNANRSDARRRAAGLSTLERA